jgi:hypothetical protein
VSILLPRTPMPNLPDDPPLYARSGWPIPCEKSVDLPKQSVADMRRRASELMKIRQGLTLRSLSPYPYNCVGMIFANRRAWIEIDYIGRILKEDGYRQVRLDEVKQGDVVLYKGNNAPCHVALIVTVERYGSRLNVQVISKWGQDAEFIHYMENVLPQLGEPVEFYSDRVEL